MAQRRGCSRIRWRCPRSRCEGDNFAIVHTYNKLYDAGIDGRPSKNRGGYQKEDMMGWLKLLEPPIIVL